MTANNTHESFDAVLAEMPELAAAIADHLQSAHARELAEQQATIEALRRQVAQQDDMLGRAMCRGMNAEGKPRCLVLANAEARADAAMGLLRRWAMYGSPQNTTLTQETDAFLAQKNC